VGGPGWSGTSFASPLVAAAAALLLEKYPGLSAAEVLDAIRASAGPDQTGPEFAGLMGAGVLDLNALTQVLTHNRQSLKVDIVPEGTLITFSPVLDATRYDVARGEVSDLRAIGPGIDADVELGSLTCVSNDAAFPDAIDFEVPEPGKVYFYVFRDDSPVGGQSYGRSSGGGPRIPEGTDCPGGEPEP
jgi:subtilisin family serine protease